MRYEGICNTWQEIEFRTVQNLLVFFNDFTVI